MQIRNHIKPGKAVMLITLQELNRLGVSEQGVDIYYAQQATNDYVDQSVWLDPSVLLICNFANASTGQGGFCLHWGIRFNR